MLFLSATFSVHPTMSSVAFPFPHLKMAPSVLCLPLADFHWKNKSVLIMFQSYSHMRQNLPHKLQVVNLERQSSMFFSFSMKVSMSVELILP